MPSVAVCARAFRSAVTNCCDGKGPQKALLLCTLRHWPGWLDLLSAQEPVPPLSQPPCQLYAVGRPLAAAGQKCARVCVAGPSLWVVAPQHHPVQAHQCACVRGQTACLSETCDETSRVQLVCCPCAVV